MNAIVIKRMLSAQEFDAIRKLAVNDDHVLHSSVPLPEDLKHLNKGNFEIDEVRKKEINYECIDTVISFGDKEFEGRPVTDWMKFEGSSLWYYHKFRVYFRLRNLKYEMAEVKALNEAYDAITYYTSESLWEEISHPDNASIMWGKEKSTTKIKPGSLFKYFLILKSRWILNLTACRSLKRKEHIIMDVSKRQTVLDAETLKSGKANFIIGYLLRKAGKDVLILDEAIQPKLSAGTRISLSMDNLFGKGKIRERYFGEGLLFWYFLSPGLKTKKRKFANSLRISLDELYGHCTSQDDQLIIQTYRMLKGATGFYLTKYLAYRRFFSRHSFKSITTIDENSPARRAILDAARACGMKTIAIQHGNIYDLLPSYLYTPKDKANGVMPDLSLVWGSYYKDFLSQKANYPPASVIPAGQVRTDIIPALLSAKIPIEKVIPRMPAGHQLVTFASQPQKDDQLRRLAALDVMNAVKNIPKAYLLLKLHPNELADFDYYESIAKESGIKNYIISYHVDLYQVISVSSVVITCFSTVGSEAVYFNKPLIILDYQRQDLLKYIALKVAFPAYDEKGLMETISGILSKDLKINKEAYNNFIQQFAYKIDGKVADRLLEAIRQAK